MPHVQSICCKARNLVGLLYRPFYNNANRDTMLKVYTAIVRPHLEYAAQVWDPHLRKNAELLENVQKLALKICNKQWVLGYQALLDISQPPSLANRRTPFKLCTLFKIVNGLLDFPPNVIVPTVIRAKHNSPQSLASLSLCTHHSFPTFICTELH